MARTSSIPASVMLSLNESGLRKLKFESRFESNSRTARAILILCDGPSSIQLTIPL